MRFLADQNVYAPTIAFLARSGHDVVTAADLGLWQAPDIDLLRKAGEDGRIFLTHDRDFGGLVFVQGEGGGVIYLRMTVATMEAVHQELARVLSLYAEAGLREAFVVVEPGRHRIRRRSADSPGGG